MTDWRLQGQEKFLMRAAFAKRQYQKYRDDWDHDHCEFCSEKFSEGPKDLHVGYATQDNLHWVCEGCFEDFKQHFQWRELSTDDVELSND